MDGYHNHNYNSTEGSSGGRDRYSRMDASSSAYTPRGWRPSQQFSASADLGPAFNACAGATPMSGSSGSVDIDPSLLRYTRPRPFSSSSSSSDECPLYPQFLHQPSLLGYSSASPLSLMGRAQTPPPRYPPLYCTPGRDAVMEDGVLVINDSLRRDNTRVGGGAIPRRSPDFGSYSAASGYGGRSSNRYSSSIDGDGGTRVYPMGRRRSFEEVGHAMQPPQMRWQPRPYQSRSRNRNRAFPGVSPAATSVPPAMGPSTHPAITAGVRGDGFRLEVGGQVNRHSSVPRAPLVGSAPGAPQAGPAPGAMAAMPMGSAGGPGGAIPPPPPPSASTFVWPPTEEQEAEIQRVLYGPRHRRRLSAFEQICPTTTRD